MKFGDGGKFEKIGEKTGFVLSFFIFTTFLFFALRLGKKLPSSWTYWHIMLIVFFIALIGYFIKRLLK